MAVATYQEDLGRFVAGQHRPAEGRPVYTIGFSLWEPKDWYKALKLVNVNLIYDVRRINHTRFRKPFGRKALEKKANQKMRYTADVDLGPPRPLREGMKEGLRQGLGDDLVWAQYAVGYYEYLNTPDADVAVGRLLAAYDEPGTVMVLFCFERGALQCHRRLLAEHMREKRPEIVPLHIIGLTKRGVVFE